MHLLRPLTLPLVGALALSLVAGTTPKSKAKAPTATVLPPAPIAPAAPVKVATVEGITEYHLANGLRVLLFPDASKPTITTNITYLVGSRHEHYGETGMAHLLEHMVFKGTPRHPNVPQLLNELGGDFNGTTSLDRTNYYISFPASDENLAKALDLEADRMVNSSFTAKTLWGDDGKSGEMTVVRNEFETGENSPFRVTFERLQSVAYDWHNYGKSTIGARTDIEQVNVDHLRAFYAKYYQPDNAILVVAGKFDEAKALSLITKHFGPLPKPNRTLEPTYTREPVQDGERSVTVRRVGGTPLVIVGYHVAPGFHTSRSQLDLAASILTEAPGGRLYKALVETKLAAQVFGFTQGNLEPGLLMFGAMLPKDGDAEKVKQVLLQELEDLKAKPFTAAELERAQAKVRKIVDQTFSDTKSLAVALSESMANGDWRHLFLDRDWCLDAKLPQVQSAAEAVLKQSNRTLAQYVPTEKPDRAALPEAAPLSLATTYKGREAMVQGEAFDATPDAVDARALRFTAPNGLKGALLPKKTKGAMAAAQLTLRFGTESDLSNRGAVPGLVGTMLMRGTTAHSRQELADAFDKLRAQVNVSASFSSVTANIVAPRENMAATLKLVAEVLRTPAFPAAELETLLKQQATGMEAQRHEPQSKVVEFMGQTFDAYPAGHPMAYRSLDARLEDLKAVKVEDLKAFHRAFYGAAHGEFAASGDFDAAETQKLVTELFGDWKASQAYARVPARLKTPAGLRKAIETPDKKGAFFLVQSRWAMKDTDADYPAFLMANQILGGGALKSRLADRLRQKEGFSYGAGSFVNANSQDPIASWQAYAIYAPENAAKLEAAFDDEIQKALKDGFTQEELDFARTSWLQGEKTERQEDRAIARWLGRGLYLGRSPRFEGELEAKVQALTLAQVNAALRAHLNPSTFVVVKAGDFAKGEKK